MAGAAKECEYTVIGSKRKYQLVHAVEVAEQRPGPALDARVTWAAAARRPRTRLSWGRCARLHPGRQSVLAASDVRARGMTLVIHDEPGDVVCMLVAGATAVAAAGSFVVGA